MKEYSPLALDITKDEPSFVNDEGVKWWLVRIGSRIGGKSSPKDGAVYLTLLPNGTKNYVVIDRDGEIVKVTPMLEHALAKTDVLYLMRTKRVKVKKESESK